MALQPYNVGAIQKFHTTAITTTTEVKPYRFISGTTGTYVAASTTVGNDGGVTDKDVASGYDADVVDAGIVPVYAVAAVAIGPVEIVGAAGGIQTKVSGVTVGKALTAGSAGDLVLVFISNSN